MRSLVPIAIALCCAACQKVEPWFEGLPEDPVDYVRVAPWGPTMCFGVGSSGNCLDMLHESWEGFYVGSDVAVGERRFCYILEENDHAMCRSFDDYPLLIRERILEGHEGLTGIVSSLHQVCAISAGRPVCDVGFQPSPDFSVARLDTSGIADEICGFSDDGQHVCWTAQGLTMVPGMPSDAIDVKLGVAACWVAGDGTGWCLGSNLADPPGEPLHLADDVVSVAGHGDYAVFIRQDGDAFVLNQQNVYPANPLLDELLSPLPGPWEQLDVALVGRVAVVGCGTSGGILGCGPVLGTDPTSWAPPGQ